MLLRRRQIPRVELKEMGPSLDLALRRHRLPAPDLEKEALRQPKVAKKKARRPWECQVYGLG
jgi:ribosome production factor 2